MGPIAGLHGPGSRHPYSWHQHGDGPQSASRQQCVKWSRGEGGMRGREGGHIPLGSPAKSTPEFHYVIALQLTSNYVSSQKARAFELKSKGQFLPLNRGGGGNIWSVVDPSSLSQFIRNQELIFANNCLCIYFLCIWYLRSVRCLAPPQQHFKKSKPLYAGFYLGSWYSESFYFREHFKL